MIGLRQNTFGKLVLTLPSGENVAGVAPVRCFPFSAPEGPVSFLDEQGHEVFYLSALEELPAAVRKLVEEELARREFLPIIKRVRSVSAGAEPTQWHVETDRGETRFTLQSEDDIRRLPPRGALIADENGVRFRILDIRALDAHSRRILGRYL